MHTPSLYCFAPQAVSLHLFFSSDPPFLSSGFYCFSTCTSPNMAPNWLHIPFLFQHLINCVPVPNSLDRKSYLPILGRIAHSVLSPICYDDREGSPSSNTAANIHYRSGISFQRGLGLVNILKVIYHLVPLLIRCWDYKCRWKVAPIV